MSICAKFIFIVSYTDFSIIKLNTSILLNKRASQFHLAFCWQASYRSHNFTICDIFGMLLSSWRQHYRINIVHWKQFFMIITWVRLLTLYIGVNVRAEKYIKQKNNQRHIIINKRLPFLWSRHSTLNSKNGWNFQLIKVIYL